MKLPKKVLAAVCLLILTISQDSVSQSKEIVSLKDHREIFVDRYLIDTLKEASLKLNEPRNEGPVMKFDKPWEGAFSGYCTIIHDDDMYRAYYRGHPVAARDGSEREVTCYAESKDGIHWDKPTLGISEVEGSTNNNVILVDAAPMSHNFSPFIDKNPEADPNQKYKAIGGVGSAGLFAYSSSDGIHWQKIQEAPVFTEGKFDSQNVAFWSESEGQYVCYFRTLATVQDEWFRSVSRTTSPDFIHWSEPVAMTFGDTPYEHLYTQQTSPYFRAPHIYVAIGARFMPNRQVVSDEQAKTLGVNPSYYKDCSDAILMSTRGGSSYDRTFMDSFIRPGIGLDNWVSRSNYPALNVVQTSPTEMSVYLNEDYAQPSAKLTRYSMRLDGFSSITAPYEGGEFITKLFTFEGNELEINYATSAAGEIRVEIQDEDGQPLPGFSLEDSEVIIGNEIKRIVSWKGNTNVASINSTPVRLRIHLKDADLYSLKFNQ